MWVTNNRKRSMINNNLMNARPLKSIKSDRRWRVQEFKSLLVWIGNVAERRNNSSRVEKTIRKFISVSIGEIERERGKAEELFAPPDQWLQRGTEKVDIYNGWVLSWRPFLFIWNSPESIRPSVSSLFLHHVGCRIMTFNQQRDDSTLALIYSRVGQHTPKTKSKTSGYWLYMVPLCTIHLCCVIPLVTHV